MTQLKKRTTATLVLLATALICVFLAYITTASSPLTITNPKAVNPFFSPNTDTINETTAVTYTLSAQAYVTVKIFSPTHTLVRTFMKTILQNGNLVQDLEAAGTRTWVWDGKDESGLASPPGIYSAEIYGSEPVGGTSATVLASVSLETSPVVVALPAAASTIGGVVPLAANKSSLIEAPYDQVGFKYKSKTASTWTDIGRATKQVDGSYTLVWDTTTNVDGEYQLKARLGYLYGGSLIVLDESPVTNFVIDNPVHFLQWYVTPTVFSPNGDNARDTAGVVYILSRQATTTSKIYNPYGNLVRTLENQVVKPSGVNNVIWNGKDDTGAYVPSGLYTARFNATDPNGAVAEEKTATVTVDWAPATITTPPAGATLAGTVSLVTVPSQYAYLIGYNTVHFYYQTNPTSNQNYWAEIPGVTRQADGSYLASWDTTKIADGGYKIRSGLGSSSGSLDYSAPIPITVNNPVGIFNITVSPTPFSPTADGWKDTTNVYYSLSRTAWATVRVYDTTGTLIRTILNDVSQTSGTHYVTWDGKNDASAVVASGTYLIKLDARDTTGNQAIQQTISIVADANPVTISAPTISQTINGTATLAAAPSPFVPASNDTMEFIYQPNPTNSPSSWTRIGLVERDSGGAFTFNWDTSAVPEGNYNLRADIGWVYQDNSTFYTYDHSTPITVRVYTPLVVAAQAFTLSTFSPNGDGARDTTTLGYSLTRPATVTTRICDSSGSVVRTLENLASRASGASNVIWDGKDDLSAYVATGIYTARITASDLNGAAAEEKTANITVDRAPAVVTAPSASAQVAGLVNVLAEPSVYASLLGFNTVHLYYQTNPTNTPNYWVEVGVATLQADGKYRAVWDTTGLSDGDYKLKVGLGFASGSIDYSPPVSVTVANTPPTTLILAPLNGTSFKDLPILVAGNCADASGTGAVSSVEIKLEDASTGASVIDWEPAEIGIDGISWSTLVSPSREGRLIVKARATSSAGVVETPGAGSVIYYDVTPPVTTSNSGVMWHNTNTSVSFSATDTVSGVANTKYRIDGGAWHLGTATTVGAPSDHSNDGVHDLEFTSMDKAGNEETARTAEVKIDTTTPTTTLLVTTPSYGTSPITVGIDNRITLLTFDAGSGVRSTIYKVSTETDPGSWQTYTESFSITTAGLHTISFKSTDNISQVEQERQVTVFVDATGPAQPTGLNAINARLGWTIDLSWASTTEMVGYDVYRSLTSGGPYIKLTESPIGVSSYRDIGIANGREFYYVVRAINIFGIESDASVEVSAIATPPDDIPPVVYSMTPADTTVLNTPCAFIQAHLSDEGGAGVDLEASTITVTTNGVEFPGVKIVDTFTSSVMFYPSAPFPDNTYNLTVTPYDKAGNVGLAYHGSFVIDTSRPGQVDTLSASPSDAQAVLRWTAPADEGPTRRAKKYLVKKSTSPIYDQTQFNAGETVSNELVPLAAGETESLAVNNLTNGSTYYFAIRAVDTAGNNGEISNLVTAKPMPNSPVSNLVIERVDSASFVKGDKTTFSAIIKNSGNTTDTVSSVTAGTDWVNCATPLPLVIPAGETREATFIVVAPPDISDTTTYRVSMTVTSTTGSQTSSSIAASVQTTSAASIPIKVIDAATGIGISDAIVILGQADTEIGRQNSGSSGLVTFNSIDRGEYIASVYKPGYAPKTVIINANAGENTLTKVALEVRSIIVASIEHRLLSATEVSSLVACGVLNASANSSNYRVFRYDVEAIVTSTTGNGPQSVGEPMVGYRIEPFDSNDPGGTGDGTGGTPPEPARMSIATLKVPIEAKYFKEMFEVILYVKNNASAGITLTNTNASLILPASGLGYAAMTPPQTPSKIFGDLASGATMTRSWILTGEQAGDYVVSAHVAGTVMPFNAPIEATVTADRPIKVQGQNMLTTKALVPSQAVKDGPFKIKFGLGTTSPGGIAQAQVKINEAGLINCMPGPGSVSSNGSMEQIVSDIYPGQTKYSTFRFISDVDGTVSVRKSNNDAHTIEVDSSLDQINGAQPLQIQMIPGQTSVRLLWQPFQSIGGITGYQIYRSESRQGLARAVPLTTIYASGFEYWVPYTDTGLQPGRTYWYAINTNTPDGWDTLHRIGSVRTTSFADTPNPDNIEHTGDIIADLAVSARTINPYDASSSIILSYRLVKSENVNLMVKILNGRGMTIYQKELGNDPGPYVWVGIIDDADLPKDESAGIMLAPRGWYKLKVEATDGVKRDSMDVDVKVEY